jgi:addiction module HigA family antidote
MALIAIHPGEHLADELKKLHLSAAELARKLNVPTNRITGILNGQRAIAGDTALRLSSVPVQSSGSTSRAATNCAWAQKKAGKSIKALPTLKRAEHLHAS